MTEDISVQCLPSWVPAQRNAWRILYNSKLEKPQDLIHLILSFILHA